MYFDNKKTDTNIDKDFKKENNLSSFILKYKKIIIISIIAIMLLIIMLLMFVRKKITIVNFLTLIGEETITIYKESDYIEPGYNAYNSKNIDLTSEVIIHSNLNIKEIGEYEITYTLGDITEIRKVIVIEKPKEYTYIYLKSVNNSMDIYVQLGEKYIEPGFQVFNTNGKNLEEQVKITGNVDTSKKGSYIITYSLVDSNNVTISKSRKVHVIDADINLSLTPSTYTNQSVDINVKVVDDYFDYIVLPNNEKITTSTHTYTVTENGKYTFTAYNVKGMSKKQNIEVKNIDRTPPTGTCTIDQYNTKSIINISAKDEAGIKKYIYNNQEYTSNTINLSTSINNAKITIYDNANNTKNITCTLIPKAYISNIEKDGVIITVHAKKVNNSVSGYYFSYNNQRPNKNSGGYISTSNEVIDVVRLPGTTYVWVEDNKGKISDAKTINISNDALLNTNGDKYKILEDPSLETYLINKGWSLEELNKLMARSVRAAGLYTKEAAATAAVSFQTVLAQKYKIKLPYYWSGKSWNYGADPGWGQYKVKTNGDITYYYYGLDCSGFTTWAYVNAGYNIKKGEYPGYFWGWKKHEFTKENGEIGDFITSSGHVKLIVGKTDTGFITAEAKGKDYGMVINIHKYNSPNGYKIQKGELMMEEYEKISSSDYPTGF